MEAAEAGGMAKKKGSYHMPLVTYERTPYVATAPREALAMLLRSSVKVVPNMLLRERAAATHSGLMDTLEGVFPVFKRDDATTWRQLSANWAKHAMLLQHHWLGWCQAAVDVRQDPKIAAFFAAVGSARAVRACGTPTKDACGDHYKGGAVCGARRCERVPQG